MPGSSSTIRMEWAIPFLDYEELITHQQASFSPPLKHLGRLQNLIAMRRPDVWGKFPTPASRLLDLIRPTVHCLEKSPPLTAPYRAGSKCKFAFFRSLYHIVIRQFEDETRAARRIFLNADASLMLRDDPADDGQPQSRSAFASGKIRLEDSFAVLGRDAGAGVGDDQFKALSLRDFARDDGD